MIRSSGMSELSVFLLCVDLVSCAFAALYISCLFKKIKVTAHLRRRFSSDSASFLGRYSAVFVNKFFDFKNGFSHFTVKQFAHDSLIGNERIFFEKIGIPFAGLAADHNAVLGDIVGRQRSIICQEVTQRCLKVANNFLFNLQIKYEIVQYDMPQCLTMGRFNYFNTINISNLIISVIAIIDFFPLKII